MELNPINDSLPSSDFNTTYSVPARARDNRNDAALHIIKTFARPTNCPSKDNVTNKSISPSNGGESKDTSHFKDLSYGGANESSDPPTLTGIMSDSMLTGLLGGSEPEQPLMNSSSIVDQSSNNLSAVTAQIIQSEQNTHEATNENFGPPCDVIYIATEVIVPSDAAVDESMIVQAMEQRLLFNTPNDTGGYNYILLLYTENNTA